MESLDWAAICKAGYEEDLIIQASWVLQSFLSTTVSHVNCGILQEKLGPLFRVVLLLSDSSN